MKRISRRIGADLGFIGWQKPVTMKEFAEIMFGAGMSQQEVMKRLGHRFNERYIGQTWRDVYNSRPTRPSRDWRPKVMSQSPEARP